MKRFPLKSSRRLWIWGLVIFAGVVAWLLVPSGFLPRCEAIQTRISAMGALGGIGYFVGATLLMSLFVPRTPVVILGAVSFDLVHALFWVMTSSMASATLSYYFARYQAPEVTQHALQGKFWFEGLKKKSREHGFRIVALSRLVHVLHFAATGCAFGLFKTDFKEFFWGTFFGVLPGSVFLIYASNRVGCALLSGGEEIPASDRWALGVAGTLLCALIAVPLFRNSKKEKESGMLPPC